MCFLCPPVPSRFARSFAQWNAPIVENRACEKVWISGPRKRRDNAHGVPDAQWTLNPQCSHCIRTRGAEGWSRGCSLFLPYRATYLHPYFSSRFRFEKSRMARTCSWRRIFRRDIYTSCVSPLKCPDSCDVTQNSPRKKFTLTRRAQPPLYDPCARQNVSQSESVCYFFSCLPSLYFFISPLPVAP